MSDERKEKQNKALAHLHTQVAATLNSDTWKAALAFRRRLQHPYSLTNLLLIHSQRPDATMVAGFHKWREVGRNVRKGEKGIMILAPLTRKRENDAGEEERAVFGFRTAYVFDVSQTDGEEIPLIPKPTLLEGSDDAASEAVAILEALIKQRGWALKEGGLPDGALGSWTPAALTVRIRPDLAPLQRAKTLAHEIAHAAAEHGISKDERVTAELEAETTAYLVMDSLGLDTGDYSFAYLSNWMGGAKALDALLEAGRRATKLADDILDALTAIRAVGEVAA